MNMPHRGAVCAQMGERALEMNMIAKRRVGGMGAEHWVAGMLALFAGSSACGQSLHWSLRQVIGGPSPRTDFGMVFDSVRGVTVLYGGGSYLGDTWQWDGTAWSQLPVSGPPARNGHAMSYDSTRGVSVMFGGFGSGVGGAANALQDTWEWNGSAWVQRQVTGPSARYAHGMAYDSVRHITVLFGGDAGTGPASDTWEWDGTAWTARGTGGPPGRYNFAMAFDAGRGMTVVFGGVNRSGPGGELVPLGDTWEWNGTAWTQRLITGPAARQWPSMSYDSGRGTVVLFGGRAAGQVFGDTWELSGPGWSRRAIQGPTARAAGGLAYDSRLRLSLVFGGASMSNTLGDIWELGCYGNCDHSTTPPVLNANDFQCFLSGFAAGQAFANCDGSALSPVLNVNDFQCFLNAFAAGCL